MGTFYFDFFFVNIITIIAINNMLSINIFNESDPNVNIMFDFLYIFVLFCIFSIQWSRSVILITQPNIPR